MMDFLKTLKAHRGGLLRIKSELFWYDGRGWDGVCDRVCLILDAASAAAPAYSAPAYAASAAASIAPHSVRACPARGALLLIDGCPVWVWVSQEDVELIT